LHSVSNMNKDEAVEGILQEIKLDKEGKPVKYKSKLFILLGGTLHSYAKPRDVTPKTSLDLCKIEFIESPNIINLENCFAIKNDEKTLILHASGKEEFDIWNVAFKESKSKEPTKPPIRSRKKEGNGFVSKTKTALGGKVITSSFGKSMVKEVLPDDAWLIIDCLKSFVAKISGDKFADTMYNQMLKFAVQVTVLCREKVLTGEKFWGSLRKPLILIFSMLIDSLELPFSFDAVALSDAVRQVELQFTVVFASYLQADHMEEVMKIINYFSPPEIWTKLYTDSKYNKEVTLLVRTLRKIWDNLNSKKSKYGPARPLSASLEMNKK